MDADGSEESQGVRRFNPFRSVRRGLKAACSWTIRLGRGRSASAPRNRAGRRGGRGRRGAPLASLAAAMLEPGDIMDLGDEPCAPSTSGHQHMIQPPRVSALSPMQLITAADAASGSNSFPLVLRRPNFDASPFTELHSQQPRRALHYHAHADDLDVYSGHHHHHHHGLASHDEAPWMHHHQHHHHQSCSCGGVAAGLGCGADCPAAAGGSSQYHQRHHGCSSDSGGGGGAFGCGSAGLQHQQHQQLQSDAGAQGHSLQHLLAVGSRQWGSGGWWDGRALLRVKIYDFAVYADATKAAHVLRSAAGASSSSLSSSSRSSPPSSDCGLRRGQLAGSPSSSSPSSSSSASRSPAGRSPTELLVSPSTRVPMSLTIRACRNLPLTSLSQEFERVLQRRHEKAGGRPDDPALQELLSYFSRERLPEHVVVRTTANDINDSSDASGAGGDAVRKGASITFSRSPCGSLVTEAGGRVLGRVHSPPLAEALFDLYLGDMPVSKKAKAAAGAALLDMAAAGAGSGSGAGGWGLQRPAEYRYRPQSGERVVCGPGARGPSDVDACVVEVP